MVLLVLFWSVNLVCRSFLPRKGQTPEETCTCRANEWLEILVTVADHVPLQSFVNAECLPTSIALVGLRRVDQLMSTDGCMLAGVEDQFRFRFKLDPTDRTLERAHYVLGSSF